MIYLTRDRDEEGELMPWVDVWLTKPRRVVNPLAPPHASRKEGTRLRTAHLENRRRGGHWIADSDPSASFTPEEVERIHGVKVVSDRECHEVPL